MKTYCAFLLVLLAVTAHAAPADVKTTDKADGPAQAAQAAQAEAASWRNPYYYNPIASALGYGRGYYNPYYSPYVYNPYGGIFGGWGGNTAISNAGAFSLFGPANSNAFSFAGRKMLTTNKAEQAAAPQQVQQVQDAQVAQQAGQAELFYPRLGGYYNPYGGIFGGGFNAYNNYYNPYGIFGGWGNNAYSNAGAFSLFGPSNANAISIAGKK